MKISTPPSFGAGRMPTAPRLKSNSEEPPGPNDSFQNNSEPPLKKSEMILATTLFVGVPLTGVALGAYVGHSMAAAHPILGIAAGAVGGLVGTLLLGTMVLNGATC